MSTLFKEKEIELDEDTQKDKYLTFVLGEESYGIEIQYVKEIIGLQPITEMPELPAHIKGVINLRGTIIPLTDVRILFNKMPREYDDRTCIIVIDYQDISVGLIVDTVSEVLDITEKDICPPPSIKNHHSKYIKGIGKIGEQVKLLLDCSLLFSSKELLEPIIEL